MRSYRRKPKASDLLVISLKLVAETMGISSENNLYHRIEPDYPGLRKQLPDRSNFNRRCRSLTTLIVQYAAYISEDIMPSGSVYLIDSTVLPICRNARIPRLKIMRDNPEMLPARGWSACDKQYFYGYKLHLLTSRKGLISSYFVTPGNIHDSDLTLDLCRDTRNADIYGDKGYVNKCKQLELFEEYNTTLITPPKQNARQPSRAWNPMIFVQRKRIETTFSQFVDQFGIK